MAAMIWDEQTQAFVEATNTPLVYDAKSSAFVETTGLVWDAEAQAWEKAWNQKEYIYSYGRHADNFFQTSSYGSHSFAKNPDNLYTYGYYPTNNDWNGVSILDNVLHYINNYKALYWRVDMSNGGKSKIGFAKGNNSPTDLFGNYNNYKWFSFFRIDNSNDPSSAYHLISVENGLYAADLVRARKEYPEIFDQDGWYVGISTYGFDGSGSCSTYEIWLE